MFTATFAALFFVAPPALAASVGSLSGWQSNSSNPLPQGLSSATSVTYNGYIYVMGGYNNTAAAPQSTVYYAKLNNNGSLGSWQTDSASPLPQILTDAASVAYNGYVYVMGGTDSLGNSLTTVYYSKVNSDGSLGTWQTDSASPLPNILFYQMSVTYNGYIYAIGGNVNNGVSLPGSTVYYVKVNSDGSLGTWQTDSASPLPIPLEGSGAVINNGYVYIIGGLTYNTGLATTDHTYYAKFNSDGSLGSWQTGPTLPQPVSLAASSTYNGYVYLVGGFDSSVNALTTVYYSKLSSNGSLGSWQTDSANPLPKDIARAASATNNGYFYISGGQNSGGQFTSTYYTSFVTSALTAKATSASAPNTGYGQPASYKGLVIFASLSLLVTIGGALLLRSRKA